MKTNKKETNELVLKYNGMTIKTGDDIIGTINGVLIEGKLYIEHENRFYFCQNKKKGRESPDKLGFNYSWAFLQTNEYTLSDYVIIFKTKPIEYPVEYIGLNCNKDGSHTITLNKIKSISVNNELMFKKETPINFFRMRAHPDCCGASILYNFPIGNNIDFTTFQYLRKKDYITISNLLMGYKTAKVAHLASNQPLAMDFLIKLGFKEVFSYINPNTKRTITVFHCYPDMKLDENSEFFNKKRGS